MTTRKKPAGAPSDRAGKVREIVEQWLRDNWTIGCPNGRKGDELIAVIESLLDAECKVEVAAALAECAESLMKKYHADFQIGVCRAYELISNFLPSPNYIALRAAAALEQAAEHIPEQSHEATGYLIRCACGWKSLAYKVDWRIEDGSSRGFSEWQQHIRALSPDPNYIALREADARIAEADWWIAAQHLTPNDLIGTERRRYATLTEARDKLAKK